MTNARQAQFNKFIDWLISEVFNENTQKIDQSREMPQKNEETTSLKEIDGKTAQTALNGVTQGNSGK